MNSTPASSIAANAVENSSDATPASAKDRTRSIAGSTTGEGCVRQRTPERGQAHGRGRDRAERRRAPPAPVGRLDEPERQQADRRREDDGARRGRAGSGRDRCSRAGRAARSRRRARPTGTLTRNTSRQLASTSSPPIGGPAAAATAPTAAQMLIAFGRSAGANSGSSSASDVGSSTAPPAAWITRAPISSPTEFAIAAQRRPDDEHDDAAHEGPLAPDAVGHAPGRHEQRREHDRVGVEHPRHRRDARARRRPARCPGRRC